MHSFLVTLTVLLLLQSITEFVKAGKAGGALGGAYFLDGLMDLGLAVWGLSLIWG